MVQFDPKKEKLKLEYPCKWTYKIIGKSEEMLRNAVKHVLLNQTFELTPSNSSKSGKYFSMKLELLVLDDDDRKNLFKKLQQNPDIVMVL